MADRHGVQSLAPSPQARDDGTARDQQVWLITGAGRGMGVDFVRAVLAAGNAVVATGPHTVRTAVGEAADLVVVALAITVPADAQAAVQAAVNRFGRIDVLVNTAARGNRQTNI